ncbi:MAG: hypothetical protein GY711_01525 [bacterium]|nr:hypothetical protein [bacterium]
MYETGVEDAQVTLAPFVPDLAALGARTVGDLLGTGAGLEGEGRAAEVARESGTVLLRCPLPGTPTGPDAPLSGRPRGAGTGFVFVRRYSDPPLGQCLRARFTKPRSESLAAREWNLLCHLRAAGVPTPEPMAVASAGRGVFARRSVLVTRELDAMRPAPEFFADEHELERRRLALRALGQMLARLCRVDVWLPRLAARHFFIGEPRAAQRADLAEDACAADQILAAQGDRCSEGPPVVPGLSWSREPEVAIASVRGGRILSAPLSATRRTELLAKLASDVRLGEVLSERERLRLCAHARFDRS